MLAGHAGNLFIARWAPIAVGPHAAGGVLVSIAGAALAIPILIFGVSASYAAVTDPDPFLPPFMILSAIALFFAALGPVAAAAALKGASD